MVIYVFGIIVMEPVIKRLKLIHKYLRYFGQLIINKLSLDKVIRIILYIFGIIHRWKNVIHCMVNRMTCYDLRINLYFFRSYVTYTFINYGSKGKSSCEFISRWDNSILELFSYWCSTKEKTWNDTYTFLSNQIKFLLSIKNINICSPFFFCYTFSCQIDLKRLWKTKLYSNKSFFRHKAWVIRLLKNDI
jgi:hypothetical protein